MKKAFYITGLALCLGLTACGDDDDADAVDCVALSNTISTTASEYGNDPSTENCEAYKKSIQDFLNSGCADEDETGKASLESILAAFDCSN